MNRYLSSPLPVLLGAVSFTLAAQAGAQSSGGRTGTATSTQALPQGAATASTSAPAPGSAPSRSASNGEAIPQGSITSMGGFAQPYGAQAGTGGTAPGDANDTFASASTLANGTIPGAVATGGAGTGAMGAGTFASSGNTGSYSPTPLATIARGMAGTSAARLPNTALRSGALASIEGSGRHLVTRTALTTWRVNSWDGTSLVVTDDQGHRRTFTIVRGVPVPRNLHAGKLVVLDLRGDTLRAVRYLL